MFVGLGRFDPCHIIIDDVEPVIHASRRVPHALHDRLRGKLVPIERDGIISKVDKPADWVR